MYKLKDALQFSIEEGRVAAPPLCIVWEAEEVTSHIPFERDLDIKCEAIFNVKSILSREAMKSSRFDMVEMLKKDMAQHIMCSVYRPVEDKVRDLHMILMQQGSMSPEVKESLAAIYNEMRYIS